MGYILIAEDDRDILLIMQRRLEMKGYETRTASNGQAALDLAFEERPSLVVLDVMLPELDGLTVCAKIKTHFAPQPPNVILVTARGQPAQREEGRQAGADVYLVKPFSPRELLQHVEALYGR
ncbi:MAG: response regulator transcription factor [Anaerolineales bacterium]